jgi:hypothetical protein
MEDLVKKLIDSMIEQAKAETQKLAKQLEVEGRIAIPQPLAEGVWSNSKGEEFGLVIMLDMAQSAIGRQMGRTSLQLYTEYDGKFVIDNYRAGLFGSFADAVYSEEFRIETEGFIGGLTADDGSGMKTRIINFGTCAIPSLIVPDKAQMDLSQIPSDCTLSVCGVVFEGIDEILDYWRNQTDGSQPYIIARSQRFPCFDAEDYATERRFYRNFLICRSKKEADKKTMSMEQLREGSNFCLVNNSLPADMRPMVYYEDESTSMSLAY